MNTLYANPKPIVKPLLGPEAGRREVLDALARTGPDLDALYRAADACRHANMGDSVHIRGIIEFSNVCARDCAYCGIRAENDKVARYTLSEDEIVETARKLERFSQTTVVLQAGESGALDDEALGALIRRIKRETRLAVTLSVGVRPEAVYRFWRACGMDRYLIRFETSDPVLYTRVHPDSTLPERLEALAALKRAGVQTGSGFLIGLPGETVETLADNLLLCRDLELDMIGIGPFIPHPDTPLGHARNAYDGDRDMFFRAVSVLRLLNPAAHIPATTAFDTVFPGEGRNLALQRGANIFMPNNTPARHRRDYLLYPGKPCVDETSEQCGACVLGRLRALGRTIGVGPGHSRVHPVGPPAAKETS